MSLRNLLWFYRRRLRARAVQELLALVGIAVGVALLFAVQVSNRSLSASIAQLTSGLVGRAQLQLAARGPEGFDERLLREVDAVEGVRASAPLLQVSVNLVGPRGERAATLLAADPRLARMGGKLLSGYAAGRLASLRAAVLPSPIGDALGVHFGESVTLQVQGRSVLAPIGAIVGSNDVGVLAEVPAIVMPLDYAQQITGMEGRVSRIVVLADPTRREEVAAALQRISRGRVDVRATDSDARVFAQATLPNDQSTAFAISHTYGRAGTYVATVSSSVTSSSSASVVVTDPPAQPGTPVAALSVTLTCTPATHGTPTPCNVSATYAGSGVPSANITGVQWDWGDGVSELTTKPVNTHAYVSQGTYRVFASVNAQTVNGVQGATTSTSVVIP